MTQSLKILIISNNFVTYLNYVRIMNKLVLIKMKNMKKTLLVFGLMIISLLSFSQDFISTSKIDLNEIISISYKIESQEGTFSHLMIPDNEVITFENDLVNETYYVVKEGVVKSYDSGYCLTYFAKNKKTSKITYFLIFTDKDNKLLMIKRKGEFVSEHNLIFKTNSKNLPNN